MIARHLVLTAAAAMIAAPTASGHAQQSAPTRPTAPPAPAGPVVPQIAPITGSDVDIEHLVDSMHALGESQGQIGRQIGEFYRTSGKHLSDSLRNAIRVHVQALTANAAAHAAGSATTVVTITRSPGVQPPVSKAAIAQLIDHVRHDPDAIPMPPTDSFIAGGVTIGATDHRTGTVAAVDGPLDVSGTIDGNAIAVNGDVVLHPGSHVHGSVFTTNGVVRMDGVGGIVDGEIRSVEGTFGSGAGGMLATTTMPAHESRWHATRLAVAAFGLMLMLSIGVLTFAEEQLDNVTATLADQFGRSAWYGIVGQIALLPVLLALIVALAITIIGIVAIPFAIIGFVVLAVGAATLGFMAVAEAGGTSILRSQSQASLTARGAQLRAIVTGIGIFGGLWVFTAILGSDFVVGAIVRGVVIIITVVAVTVGFGAVLVWRLELRRAGRMAKKVSASLPGGDAMWQTPTPVAGVAAARRPTPAGTAAAASGASTPMPSQPPAASRSAE
jgi:hypothetical protein